MLSFIDINDVAVIKQAKIEFENGLSVLTGETGAGKSIILDAIGMVLGRRTGREIVRHGSDKARVAALFYLNDEQYDTLQVFGVEKTEDNTLLLQRELSADGKGSVRINGSLSSVAVLKEVGACLINIHGQQDTSSLYSVDRHIHILDEYSKASEVEGFREKYNLWIKRKKEFEETENLKQKRITEEDILNYQINELTALNLQENEEAKLRERAEILENSEEITNAVNEVYELLAGGRENAKGMLKDAVNALSAVADYSGDLSGAYERLMNAAYEIDDISREVSGYSDNLDFSPKELENINERLDEINRLCIKYRCKSNTLFDVLSQLEARLNELQNAEIRENDLKKEILKLESEMAIQAEKLHKIRAAAGKSFENAMEQNLADLNMKGTKFKVSIEEGEFNPYGKDKVEFLISANSGEDLKPLSKVASGGELSRVMLSLKTLEVEQGKTYIFDEIDTGISGITSEKIAEKLREVSENNQTIIITHSPQIAAAADNHYYIEKNIGETETVTKITKLDFAGRTEEIARIGSGSNITPAALKAAQELLNRRK